MVKQISLNNYVYIILELKKMPYSFHHKAVKSKFNFKTYHTKHLN